MCFTNLIYDPIAGTGFSLGFNSVGHFVFIAIPFISVSFTTYLTFAVNSFSYFIFLNFLFGLCYAFPLSNHHFVERQKIRIPGLYVAEKWRGDKTRGSRPDGKFGPEL